MANLSISEKRGLEEVFLVLNERKTNRLESLKKYVIFYKMMKMYDVSKDKLSLIRR